MNTNNLVFWRYSRGALLLSIQGPHMAPIPWFTASDLGRDGLRKSPRLVVGFMPEFPRLRWQSPGAWAGKVDEPIGSNDIVFTQLVGRNAGSPEEAPLTHPAGLRGPQQTPPTPSVNSALWHLKVASQRSRAIRMHTSSKCAGSLRVEWKSKRKEAKVGRTRERKTYYFSQGGGQHVSDRCGVHRC